MNFYRGQIAFKRGIQFFDVTSTRHTHPNMNLAEAPLNTTWRVLRISPTEDSPERAHHLEEIGFLPGELVCVLAHGFPGQDPLVVRVGLSTFALRRDEALSVLLETKDADA
jgi:ferrous iron transport protein A